MKVTTERLPKSLIALDIELDQQQVDKGLDRAARKLSQQYSIPGFRPGKAPRFIVENYLGRARIMEEATDDLINKAFQDALKQEQITPVGKANLETVEEKPFRFRVTVPVEPVVELPDYHAFHLPYEVEPVTDDLVQRLLDAQREQHAVLRELEEPRPAQPGDMLTVTMTNDLDQDDEGEDGEDDEDDLPEGVYADEVDLEDEDEIEAGDEDDLPEGAYADEVELEDDTDFVADDEAEDEDADDVNADETQIALVEDRVRPEIYAALVGAQAGETRTFTIQHGDDEEDEAVRGREVTYTVEVKNVQERLLPEWDELPTLTDFEGDIEAMRASARDRLQRASNERARKTLIDSFVDRVIAESAPDIPDAMIEERAGELFHQRVAEFARYGLSEEQYLNAIGMTHEQALDEYRDQAQKDVQRSVILGEIIRREGIRIEDADIEAESERFLEDYDEGRREQMRTLLQSPHMKTMLASSALDRKLRDRLVAIATGQAEGSIGQDSGASSGETPTRRRSRTYQFGAQSDFAPAGVGQEEVVGGASAVAEAGDAVEQLDQAEANS